MSVVRSPVSSAVSAVAISVLGGGAVSIGAQLDNALEAEAASGDFVAQPDLTDLTSIFQSDGSGNPSIGDSIDGATVLDTSQFGGKTAAEFIAGQPELATNPDLTIDASAATDTAIFFDNVVEGQWYYIEWAGLSTSSTSGIDLRVGTTQLSPTIVFNTAQAVAGIYIFQAPASGTLQAYAPGPNGTRIASFSSVSIKHLPGNHTTASGTGPTVLDDFDKTAPALTDNGGRGPELVDPDAWATGAGWTNTDGVLSRDGTSGGSNATQLTLEPGVLYEIKWTQAEDSQFVAVYVDALGTLLSNQSEADDYSVQVRVAVSSGLAFRGSAAIAGISNISVRKVLTAFDERGPELASLLAADWTPTGAGSSAASQSGSYVEVMGGAAVGQGATLDIECEIGKTYRADWAIELGTASVCDFSITETGNSSAITTTDSGQAYEYISSNERAAWEFVATATSHRIRVSPRGDGLTVSLTKLEVSETAYPNLVTNGTFDADSDWVKNTGWSIGSGVAAKSAGTASALSQALTGYSSGWHAVLFYVTGRTAGGVTPRIGDTSTVNVGSAVSANGWNLQYIRWNGSGANLNFDADASFDGSIDNVSVQEVPASIARTLYVSTNGTDDKLTLPLPARRNLLTYSEDFSNGAWVETVVGSAVLPVLVGGLVSGPTSVQNAQRVQLSLDGNTGTGDISLFRQANATTGSLTYSIYLRSHDGSSSYTIQIVDPTGNAQNVTVTGAWQRFTVSGTASGSINYGIRLRGGQSPANSDFADILIAAPQLETGSTATDYQRVGAALHDDMTVVMAIRTSDSEGILIRGDDTTKYLGAFDDGSSTVKMDNNAGSPSLRLGGAAHSPANQGAFYTSLATGDFNVLAATGIDMSTWTSVVLAFFDTGNSFNVAADYAFLSIFPTNSETLALAEAAAAEKIKIVDPTYALAA